MGANKHTLWMNNQRPAKYRVMEGKRETPCMHRNSKGQPVPCATKVRVKIAEPGVYSRTCPQCDTVSYYKLTPVTLMEVDGPTPLRFEWITAGEAEQWMKDQYAQVDHEFDIMEYMQEGA